MHTTAKSRTIIGTMAIGLFLCLLDTTVMNIALPAIQAGLNTTLSQLSWALNIYTVLFASLTIPLGRIADVYGRPRIYVLGLGLFLFGSLSSGLGTSIGWLIFGRGVQSVGAAIVFPASMTLSIQSVPQAKRTQAIAALGITQGLAAALGPTIGGVVTQFWGWRGIFLMNVPFILIALGLCLWEFDFQPHSRRTTQLDVLGSLLSMLTLFSLVLLLVKGSDWGWRSPIIIGLGLISGCALVGFILVESRAKHPMMPLALFHDRQFVGAALVTVTSGIFFVALPVLLPSFFTKVQGTSELMAALMITPASLMIFFLSPIAGFLLAKVGPRVIVFLGSFSLALGYLTLTVMDADHYWQVCLAAVLVGAGYGIIIGPVTVLAAGTFTGELLTASQSVIGVFRQIGTTLAVTIFVAGLSANLVTAKTTIRTTANQEIQALNINQRAKNDAFAQVKRQLASDQTATQTTPPITPQSQQKLVEQAYSTALQQHHLTGATAQMKRTVYRQVDQQVTQRVAHLNAELTPAVARIHVQTKAALTRAFIRPYQIALPFTILALGTTVLFESRQPYLARLRGEIIKDTPLHTHWPTKLRKGL